MMGQVENQSMIEILKDLLEECWAMKVVEVVLMSDGSHVFRGAGREAYSASDLKSETAASLSARFEGEGVDALRAALESRDGSEYPDEWGCRSVDNGGRWRADLEFFKPAYSDGAGGLSLSGARVSIRAHTPNSMMDYPYPTSWLDNLNSSDSGIVLFCGVAGGGKTTAMASYVYERLTARPNSLLVSVERPIEFVYRKDSFGSQGSRAFQFAAGEGREGWANALNAARKLRPTICSVGEVKPRVDALGGRMDLAPWILDMARSGCLVVSTLEAASLYEVFERFCSGVCCEDEARFLDAFICQLRGVVVQKLVPFSYAGTLDHKVFGSCVSMDPEWRRRLRDEGRKGVRSDDFRSALGKLSAPGVPGCLSIDESRRMLLDDGVSYELLEHGMDFAC